MKLIKKVFIGVLVIINILTVGAMLICAYSVYLPPYKYPNWSYFGMLLPGFVIGSVVFIAIWLVIKRKLSLISITGLLASCVSIRDYCPINLFQSEPKGNTLKILSYNVQAFADYDHDGHQTEIVDYITDSGADIVCLQEVSNIKKEPIYSTLNATYPYIEIGDSTETNCALLSKYPILSLELVKFGTTSSSCYLYDVQIDTDTIKVINCHLESYQLNDDDKQMYKQIIKGTNPLNNDNELETEYNIHDSFWWLEGKLAKANSARAIQADTLAALIDKIQNNYIILCGDLNDSPISYVHQTLTKKLNDAYTRSGNGPGLSYNRNGMYFRIDNILISDGFNPFGAKVDKTAYGSDHYPIFCILEMN